jgi:antitoxin HicB
MDVLYPATIEECEEGAYLVQFVDFPEAYTDGKTHEEAVYNASEVLTLTIAGRFDEGIPIPEPSKDIVGAIYVSPDAKTQAALLLKRARADKSLAELARVLETSWDAAQRLENPKHWSSLRSIDRAAAALGKRLVLSLK